MTPNRSVKKFLRVTGIILGIIIVLLVGFHFWFQAHAKSIIQDMVSSKSNGKVKLKIGKLRFNYFNRKIQLEKAVFYNTDTLTGTTAYNFKVDRMSLQAKAILPILFRKQLMIDSLTLLNPSINVIRLREGTKTDTQVKKDVSIPEEMGKVYRSIQDAIQLLKVKRFQIDNGTFTLTNKIDPEQLPLTVTNINFHIDNLEVDDDHNKANKILFSENVVLISHNQDILFPDGRHRLSFRKFRINLKKKLVEFDSCTIAATRGDSASASFNVFFNKLMLSNIDFDTLYKSEVIKADSVYCLNPTFTLDVDVSKKKGVKKDPPKLENIVQQLTGNLLLENVVVTNANFNIKTMKDGNPSSFTFSDNNFEMQGLHIDQQAKKPIVVRSFIMAIRNYENFIKDSTYSVQFDSVLFKNNRITLSNFLFTKFENGKIKNSFSIPQFNLLGMSWDDLVFDRKLKAEQAILFNPRINYTVSVKKEKREKQTIFQSLSAVNEYMDLQQIDIIDGAIDLRLKNDLHVQLENATLSVKSHSLLESKKIAGIKNSLMQLRFDKGIIHAGPLDIALYDILYVGQSGNFGAASVKVTNLQKSTAIALEDVTVNRMQVDDISGNVNANGVRWRKGTISIQSLGGGKGGGSSFLLNDVQGGNTTFNAGFGKTKVSSFINNVGFTKLEKTPQSKVQLEGFMIDGPFLKIESGSANYQSGRYSIIDGRSSSIRALSLNIIGPYLNTDISIPAVSLIPSIQPWINGKRSLDVITLERPVINIGMIAKNETVPGKTSFPLFDATGIKLIQPEIVFKKQSDSGTVTLEWKGTQHADNMVQVSGLHSDAGKLSLAGLSFYLRDFIFSNSNGRTFSTGEGKVSATIKDIVLEQQEEEPMEWKANVVKLNAVDFILDSLGKQKGRLNFKKGILSNLDISSSSVINLQQLAADNRYFQLSGLTGDYSDQKKALVWNDLNFNRSNNILTLDSFSMKPILSRDSFIAVQHYQTDYTTIATKGIRVGPVELDQFIRDKTLSVKSVLVDGFAFTDFKDKRLPFNAGIVKPLAVNILKQVPQKINIDSVHFSNAAVTYTELSEKSKKEGTIPVTRMDVKLFNVKNFNIKEGDSLNIHAEGYLMDTAWLRLRVKESYTDTLGGFLMTLRVKPTDLKMFNSALIPLASAKIESGYLDTLTMRAVGREYLSWGEMQMFYHDLKLRVLKNSDEKSKTFLNGLISFLANTFIIKSKNTSRTGNVFFIRQRDRSAINYLIKIAMSGMASSVGVKKNKKLLRKYNREIERRNLPPIDFE